MIGSNYHVLCVHWFFCLTLFITALTVPFLAFRSVNELTHQNTRANANMDECENRTLPLTASRT